MAGAQRPIKYIAIYIYNSASFSQSLIGVAHNKALNPICIVFCRGGGRGKIEPCNAKNNDFVLSIKTLL